MRLLNRRVLSDDQRRDLVLAPLVHHARPDAVVSFFEVEDDEHVGGRRLRVLVVHGGRGNCDGSAFVYDGEQVRIGDWHEHDADEVHFGVAEFDAAPGESEGFVLMLA